MAYMNFFFKASCGNWQKKTKKHNEQNNNLFWVR